MDRWMQPGRFRLMKLEFLQFLASVIKNQGQTEKKNFNDFSFLCHATSSYT